MLTADTYLFVLLPHRVGIG